MCAYHSPFNNPVSFDTNTLGFFKETSYISFMSDRELTAYLELKILNGF